MGNCNSELAVIHIIRLFRLSVHIIMSRTSTQISIGEKNTIWTAFIGFVSQEQDILPVCIDCVADRINCFVVQTRKSEPALGGSTSRFV